MKPEDILSLDATAVREAFEKRELTPEEAVEAYIRHQRKINPALNIVVEERYDRARDEARTWTGRYAGGSAVGRLAGVPISMKESFDVAGMHTTGGMVFNRDNVASADAEAVARLRAEGVVILNKTNTPTLCFCQETDNFLFGRSNNPWNPAHTTGGSSGGEAALMAVGGAAAGFGSDIGGSIRIPCHFNGVVGFKPGAFRFPDRGHFPDVQVESQKPLLGFGPIVKSVRDAALLYSVIYPEFKEPRTWDLPKDLTAVCFASFGKTRCTAETEEAHGKARQALQKEGAAVKPEAPQFMSSVSEIWQLIMSEDRGMGVIKAAYNGNRKKIFSDWLKAKLGLKAKHHPYLSWALIGTNLFPPSRKQLKWIEDCLAKGRREMESVLGNNGVFVTPAYPSPAKRHGEVYGEIFSPRKTFRRVMPFIALGNAYGLPAIVVPCGISGDGLPIGLQVACLPGNEETLFRVAGFLEKAFNGYRRNKMYD